MRELALAGKRLLFALLFMSICNHMVVRSQTRQRLMYYNITPPGEQARAISSILSDARKKFDVDFIYESGVLPVVKVVIELNKFRTVEAFLDELLKPYSLRYKKVLARAYVIYGKGSELKKVLSVIGRQSDPTSESSFKHSDSNTASRPLLITGKILADPDATPLEGVTVQVKGTSRGTETDKDGSFRVEVENENMVLLLSLIGYQPREVAVGSSKDLRLMLQSQSQSLNDAVVIGYGTQKKSLVTGAISNLKASDLEGMPVTRIEQSLQGRTSGITIAQHSGQPGAPSVVKIRGTTSINNSDPLYVVDGVPIDNGGIDYLSQADIESIEVLKDGASAAIYGTRAASGVILVTTKKGKPGNVRISYSGYYGTQSPARKLKLLNATEYATLRNESSVAAGKGTLFPNPKALGTGTDWQSLIFNNDARIQDHELSFSGGSERSLCYTSFSFFDQDGIVGTPISNYKRFTARFNASHKLRKWLNIGNNLSYSYAKTQSVGNVNSPFGGPLASAINLDPITPAIIGDPVAAAGPPYNTEPVVRDPEGRPYGISPYVNQEMSNPLAYVQTQLGNYGWAHNMVGNFFMEMEPVKGLKFRSSIGAKQTFSGNERFTPVYYLSASLGNLTNTSFTRASGQGLIWNWDNTLAYTRSFGLHNISVMGGGSVQKNTASNSTVTYFGVPATNFNEASLNYSSASTGRIEKGSEAQPYALNSYFGRVTYDYDGKYLLTGILRVDGSSRFSSNYRYGTFPSVSAGWIPSREAFWGANKAVSFLKLRASYGINGNDQSIGDFWFVTTIQSGSNYAIGNNGSLATGFAPASLANPDLKWEQTSQADLGVDAVLYKHFNLSMDVYDKRTTGMLLQVSIPGYVGVSQNPFGNVADLRDRGFEMDMAYTGKIGEVSVEMTGNASYTRNIITGIGLNRFLPTSAFQASAYEIGRTAAGLPLGSFYGFRTLGIFQTQAEVDSYVGKNGLPIQPNAKPGDFRFADLNGDGAITSDDRTFLGDPSPHWTFGFTLHVSYKNFDIRAFGQGVSGNQIFQGWRRLDILTANYPAAVLKRWTGPRTSNDFPRLTDNDLNGNFTNPSSFYLSDGAYFKVKTIQLGYTLPGRLTRRIGMQRARAYISGNNLLTITKYAGYDPEIGGTFTNQNNGSYGVDNGIYPQARSFMAGLSVTF